MPQPMAMLDTALTGSAAPAATPVSTATAIRNDTRRCSARRRYGSAVAATAMVTASGTTG